MASGIGKISAILVIIEDFISIHSIYFNVNFQCHCFWGGPL